MLNTTTYTQLSANLDYINLFDQIRQNYNTAFLLESCYELNYESRYVIIGFEPEFEFRATGQDVQIFFNNKFNTNYTKSIILNFLKQSSLKYELEDLKINPRLLLKHPNSYQFLEQLHDLFPTKSNKFCGGLIGSLGYESINYFEPSANLPENSEFETLIFGFYQDGIIFDKYTGCSEYFYRFLDRQHLLQNLFTKPKLATTVQFIGANMTKLEHRQMVLDFKGQYLSVCGRNAIQLPDRRRQIPNLQNFESQKSESVYVLSTVWSENYDWS
jgi:anthranilate synthase component I